MQLRGLQVIEEEEREREGGHTTDDRREETPVHQAESRCWLKEEREGSRDRKDQMEEATLPIYSRQRGENTVNLDMIERRA